MKLYKGKVRLAGAVTNEVIKPLMTAAEIHVLTRLHGDNSVVQVKEVGEVKKRTEAQERARLAAIYRLGPSIDGKSRLSGPAFIDSVFGVGTRLPLEYVPPVMVESIAEGEANEQEEIVLNDAPEPVEETEPVIVEDEPVAEEPIVRTRVPRAKKVADAELTA